MRDDEVLDFVKTYMPAYDLYLDRLRREPIPAPSDDTARGHETMLRVVLDGARRVVSVQEI